MASAPVGDDVFDDDRTVQSLKLCRGPSWQEVEAPSLWPPIYAGCLPVARAKILTGEHYHVFADEARGVGPRWRQPPSPKTRMAARTRRGSQPRLNPTIATSDKLLSLEKATGAVIGSSAVSIWPALPAQRA